MMRVGSVRKRGLEPPRPCGHRNLKAEGAVESIGDYADTIKINASDCVTASRVSGDVTNIGDELERLLVQWRTIGDRQLLIQGLARLLVELPL
jgi:hypothetical protein